jgi:cell shape-determining protein MreD
MKKEGAKSSAGAVKPSAKNHAKISVNDKSECGNSFGIAGVVLGVVSLASMGFPGLIMAIVGLVFSRKQKNLHENKWSKAGIILNILGIVLSAIVMVVSVYWILQYGDFAQSPLGGFG